MKTKALITIFSALAAFMLASCDVYEFPKDRVADTEEVDTVDVVLRLNFSEAYMETYTEVTRSTEYNYTPARYVVKAFKLKNNTYTCVADTVFYKYEIGETDYDEETGESLGYISVPFTIETGSYRFVAWVDHVGTTADDLDEITENNVDCLYDISDLETISLTYDDSEIDIDAYAALISGYEVTTGTNIITMDMEPLSNMAGIQISYSFVDLHNSGMNYAYCTVIIEIDGLPTTYNFIEGTVSGSTSANWSLDYNYTQYDDGQNAFYSPIYFFVNGGESTVTADITIEYNDGTELYSGTGVEIPVSGGCLTSLELTLNLE